MSERSCIDDRLIRRFLWDGDATVEYATNINACKYEAAKRLQSTFGHCDGERRRAERLLAEVEEGAKW
jgi:hypothetical protein